ncbi:MAG TPA: nucleotide-binding domain containing protein, partial [Methylomirabilota bacterium]|nr:nucleotide-binding domain containing protein [Methylomirabilota bacterium]
PAFVASVATRANRSAVARHVGQAAARVLERARPDLVAVTGGETAYALIRALGAERFDLLGAPTGGLALGRLTIPRTREIALLTKAGGFGGAGLFSTILGGTS